MIYHPRVRLKKQYTARGPHENCQYQLQEAGILAAAMLKKGYIALTVFLEPFFLHLFFHSCS